MGMGRRNELGPRLVEAVYGGIKKRIKQVLDKPGRTQVKDLTPPKPKAPQKKIPKKPLAENKNQRNARLTRERKLNENNRQARANRDKENKDIRDRNRRQVEANQTGRADVNKARLQLIGAVGVGGATGAAYATRDKPKAATASTSTTPQARKATPSANEPHPRLADFTIPAAPKKPSILSRVATSLKSKVSSKPASKPASKSISKPASKSASKPSTRKSNFRKSDNRLGGFGGAQRASARREAAKDTRSTPRATISDYTSPTPGMKAFGIEKPFAPEPKVRTKIKKSKYALRNASNVVKPRKAR